MALSHSLKHIAALVTLTLIFVSISASSASAQTTIATTTPNNKAAIVQNAPTPVQGICTPDVIEVEEEFECVDFVTGEQWVTWSGIYPASNGSFSNTMVPQKVQSDDADFKYFLWVGGFVFNNGVYQLGASDRVELHF